MERNCRIRNELSVYFSGGTRDAMEFLKNGCVLEDNSSQYEWWSMRINNAFEKMDDYDMDKFREDFRNADRNAQMSKFMNFVFNNMSEKSKAEIEELIELNAPLDDLKFLIQDQIKKKDSIKHYLFPLMIYLCTDIHLDDLSELDYTIPSLVPYGYIDFAKGKKKTRWQMFCDKKAKEWKLKDKGYYTVTNHIQNLCNDTEKKRKYFEAKQIELDAKEKSMSIKCEGIKKLRIEISKHFEIIKKSNGSSEKDRSSLVHEFGEDAVLLFEKLGINARNFGDHPCIRFYIEGMLHMEKIFSEKNDLGTRLNDKVKLLSKELNCQGKEDILRDHLSEFVKTDEDTLRMNKFILMFKKKLQNDINAVEKRKIVSESSSDNSDSDS